MGRLAHSVQDGLTASVYVLLPVLPCGRLKAGGGEALRIG